MLYLKLVFRGILRHKKRGIKFFALLTICFMMSIFSLSFQNSFYEEYVELGINARNAHINILPSDSVWLKESFTAIQKEGIPLLKVDNEFDKFINDMPEVEVGTPMIEVGGAFYTKEGKIQSGGTVTGVKAADFRRIFPGIVLIEGDDDMTVKPGSDTIPFLRWEVQGREKVQNLDRFVKDDFKVSGEEFESFKSKVVKDMPELFSNSSYEGEQGTNKFISELDAALVKKDLYSSIPTTYIGNDTFHVNYIIDELKAFSSEKEIELKNWNKRLIQSIYPEYINEVLETIALNRPMGLFVESTDDTRPPVLVPIEFVGYVEGIPEFYGYNFIEIDILQQYLDVDSDEYTHYLIRLHDEANIPIVMEKLQEYIDSKGLDYKVVDYKYIGGKTHMPLAIGVSLVFSVLVVLFLIISVFFVVYIVTVSLIRRRKEMGTVMTLGMSRMENIMVIIGENMVIMTLAWMTASIVMGVFLAYFSKNGLGGIVFFPKGKLYFNFKYSYFIYAYLLIAIPGTIASFVPTLKLKNVNIIELLRGEVSKRKNGSTSKFNGDVLKNANNKISLTLKLAVRNIFASRKRNIIIFAIFTSVVTIVYLFLAFGDGAVSNFRNGFQALNNPRAEIMGTKKGYGNIFKVNSNADELKEMTVSDYDVLLEEIQNMSFVDYAYGKTIPVDLDLFYNEARFKNLSIRGLDETMHKYILSKVEIVEGNMLNPQDKNTLLLNIVNKPEINAKVGDKITVLGTDVFNHVVTEEFTVAGYYKPKIDNPFFTTLVFTDIQGFQAVSGYVSNEINFLNIDIKKGTDVKSAVSQLNQWAQDNSLDVEFDAFANIYVRDDEIYGSGRKMISVLTYLVIFFVMIGIINMILINLFDRRKEIGTYYCVGAEKSLLIGVYTCELLIINIVATIVGSINGFGLQKIINAFKITSSNPGVQLAFGGGTFYIEFNFSTIVSLFISVVVITSIISLFSLRSSLQVSPIAAIQEIEE